MNISGTYDIVFTLTYAHNPHEFKGYLQVQSSDLIAQIQNGEYRTIAHMQKESRYAAPKPYLFQLDGSRSRDPDDPNTNITFNWYCK